LPRTLSHKSRKTVKLSYYSHVWSFYFLYDWISLFYSVESYDYDQNVLVEDFGWQTICLLK
jgi:hypothetical protein